jgi:hypothetical protein
MADTCHRRGERRRISFYTWFPCAQAEIEVAKMSKAGDIYENPVTDGFRVARLPAYGKHMAFTSNQEGGDDMNLSPVDSARQKRLNVGGVPRRRLRRVF